MNRFRSLTLFTGIGALVVFVLVAAFVLIDQREQTDDPIVKLKERNSHAAPYHIIESGYWGVPTEGESARRADLIAIAEVEDKLPAFWSTPDKQRPSLTEIDLLKTPQYRIYTPYRLQITQAIKGEVSGGGKIQLNRLGGQIDDDIVSVEDDPFELKPGTRVVVFLRDCGEERAENLGSPGARYRVINRFVADEKGNLSDSNYSLTELVEVVEQEGTLAAKGGEIGCG